MAGGGLDVIVSFAADTSQLRAEVAQVEGTGAKLKTWAKGVGAAIGAAFAIDQLKEFVKQASALQDATAATEQIFGKAGKPVKQFSKDAADAFGISKREALDAANTFAAFGKGAGKTGTDLAGFSTDLVGLAGDLASFRGTSTEEAITAVGAALRGETEPIRSFGVLLDDATLRQRALAMGLITTTKEALTPQQKVLAAQAELFAQTGDAQGDFQRTSDSAANQQKKLKAELENTQAALGTALLPVLQKILPYLSSMADFVQKNAGWLVPLVAAILAIVAAVKLWSIAQGILNIVLAANPIVLIVLAIVALIAIIVLLVKNFDVVKAAASAVWQAMQTAWDAILNAVKAAFDWIKSNWPTLLAILTGPIGIAVLLVTRNFDTIKDALASVLAWIRSAWSAVVGYLTAPFEAAWRIISGVVDSIRGVVSSVADIAGRIANAVKGPVNAVIRAWNRLEFKVPEVNVGPVHFGGQTIGLPDIPELARGGYVSRTGLALVHRGETFSGVGNAGGTVFNVNVQVGPGTDPAQVGRTLVDYIAAYERANGRQVLAR